MQGQEGLDSVLLQLAKKWDTLDTVTQRYIATQAAGSRQQSRFIALMSDYKRTMELTAAAENAAGASAQQYNKTLDSLETKMNQLKNAWNAFAMGIANSDLIKGAIDALTKFIEKVNEFNDSLNATQSTILHVIEIAVGIGIIPILLKSLIKGTVAWAASMVAAEKQVTLLSAWNTQLTASFGSLNTVIKATSMSLSKLYAKLAPLVGGALGVVAILAAIAGAIILIVKSLKTAKNNSPAGRLKSTTNLLTTLNDQLDETTTKLDEVNTQLSELNSGIEALNGLTQGTKEWNDQLNKNNQLMANFIAQYPEFSKYMSTNDFGLNYFSDEAQQTINDILNKKKAQTQGAINITQVEANKIKAEDEAAQFAKRITKNTNLSGYSQQIGQGLFKAGNANLDLTKIANKDYSELFALLREQGVQTNLDYVRDGLTEQFDANLSEIITLLTDIDSLNKSNNIINKTIAENQISDKNKNNSSFVADRINKEAQKNLTNGTDEAAKFLNSAGNIKKSEGQAFLDATYGKGLTFSKIKNGEIVYLDSNNNEQTINQKVALDTYRTQQAYTQAAEKQDVYNQEAETYTAAMVAAFNDSITQEIARSFVNQIPQIEDGIITAFNFSGIDYKKIINLDPTKLAENLQPAAEATKKAYLETLQIATDTAANLGIDPDSPEFNALINTLITSSNALKTNLGIDEALAKLTVNELYAYMNTAFGETYKSQIQKAINDKLQATKETNQNALKTGSSAVTSGMDNRFAQKVSSATDQENITNAIKAQNEELAKNEVLLKGIALQAVETTAGLTAVDEVYKENTDTLAIANKTSVEYWTSLGNIASAWNTNFGTKINSTFLGMEDNLQLFQRAMEGDVEALIEFQKKANAFDVSAFDAVLIGDEAKQLSKALTEDLTGFMGEAGEDASNAYLVRFITALLTDGRIALDQATKLLASQGYQLDIKDGKYTATNMGKDGLTIGTQNKKLTEGMDYLKGQYRLLTQITSLQQKLTKAEATYNKLVAAGNKSLRTRSKYLKEQMDANASLANAYSVLAEQRADALEKYLAEAGNSIYFEFDADAESLEQLVEEVPEDIKKNVEERYKNFLDAGNQADEYTTANYEIKKQGKADYYSLIEETAAMLQEQDQKKVELLQQQLDAEKEASKKLIESIQSNFTQLRQDRENEEKENDINTLARRIAYLRQDTSGSNALQIRQLEKELASKTQDYGDNLIDQSINQLSEQQDAAYDQRQQQIDNQSSMIEWMANYGTYNQQATEIVNDALTELKYNGTIANTAFADLVANTNKTLTASQLSEKLDSYGTTLVSALNRDYKPKVDEAITTNIEDIDAGTDEISKKMGKSDTGPIPVTISTETPEKENNNNNNNIDPNTGLSYDGWTAETDNSTVKGSVTYSNGNVYIKSSSGKSTTNTDTHTTAKTTGTYTYGSTTYTTTKSTKVDSVLSKAAAKIDTAVNKVKNAVSNLFKKKTTAYATGGLNTDTGFAWLDGTHSKPELVLNAQDTQNFLELKDTLREWKGNGITNNGNYAFDVNINVDQLSNDYDVDDLAERVEKNITDAMKYRNNTRTNRTR